MTDDGKLSVGVESNTSGFGRKLQSKLDAETRGIAAKIGLDIDAAALRSKLEAKIEEAVHGLAANISIDADIDLEGVRSKLEAFFKEPRTLTINVDLDLARARAELDAFVHERRTANVGVNVQGGDGGAGAGLRGVESAASSAGSAGLSASTALMGLAVTVLPALATAAVEVGGALGPLVGVLAAIPLAGIGIASMAVGVIASIKGISNVLKLQKSAQDTASSSGAQAAQQAQQQAESIRSAQQGVADAQQRVGDAARQSAESQISSAEAVQNAELSLTEAYENAATRQQSAARAVADAEYSLGQTRQQVAQQAQSDASSVVSAQREIISAERDATSAEQALTAAREASRRSIESLNEQVRQGALDERGATLDVEAARRQLEATMRDPRADDLARQRAQLGYDEAVEHLNDLSTKNQETQADASAANKAGVDGSNQVKSAQQAVLDAQQRQIDAVKALTAAQLTQQRDAISGAHEIAVAIRSVADAQVAQRQTAVDSARAIAAAQQSLGDAQRAQAAAAISSAEAIHSAQEGLINAQQQLAAAYRGTLSASETASEKAQAAYNKLTPLQKRLVDAIHATKPAWDAMADGASKALLPGVLAGFARLPTIMRAVQSTVNGSAKVLGDFADQGSRMMASGSFVHDYPIIGGQANDLLRAGSGFMLKFMDAMRNVLASARPLTNELVRMIGAFGTHIQKSAQAGRDTGKLTAFFQRSADTLRLFMHIIEQVGGVLGRVFTAAAPFGRDLLKSFDDLTTRTNTFLHTSEGMSRLTDFFAKVQPAIHATFDLLRTLFGAITGFMTGGANSAFITAIKNIVQLLGDIATAAGRGIALRLLIGVMGTFAQILDTLIRDVPGFNQLVSAIVALYVAQKVATGVRGLYGSMTLLRSGVEALMNVNWSTLLRRIQMLAAARMTGGFTGQLGQLRSGIAALARAGWAGIVSLVTRLGTALRALGVTMITPPVGIILLIAAIGVALYELYKHVTGFRNFVNSIARFIKEVFVKAFHLMQQVIGDVIGFIKKNWPLLLAILIGPIAILVDVIYRNWNTIYSFLKQILGAIASFFTTIWNSIKTAFIAVWDAIKTVVTTYLDLMKRLIVGTWDAVKLVFTTVWNAIKVAFTAVWDAIKTVVTIQINLIKTIITTVFNAIKTVIDGVWNAIKTATSAVWNGIRSTLTTILDTIKSAFSTAVNTIKTVWNTLADIVKKPIAFIVNTVYNDGIRAVINKVGSWVGIHDLLPEVHGFAAGGSTGRSRGRKDDRLVAVTGDEHIWTPEEVAGAGGHDVVAQLRSAALGGKAVRKAPGQGIIKAKPGQQQGDGYFPGGGVLGDVYNATIGNVVGGVEDLYHGAVGLLRKGAGAVARGILAPLRAAAKTFAQPFGNWGQSGAGAFDKTAEAVINFITGKEEKEVTEPGDGDAVTRWAPVVKSVLSLKNLPTDDGLVDGILALIRSESGGDPNAINNNDINAQLGHPSQGLMQTIPSTFEANAGKYAGRGITDPFANIWAGITYAIKNYGIGMLRAGGRHTSGGGYLGYGDGGGIPGAVDGGTFGPRAGGHVVRVAEGMRSETITDTASLNSGMGTIEKLLHELLARGVGAVFDIDITNPKPETASTSVVKALRRQSALGVIPSGRPSLTRAP